MSRDRDDGGRFASKLPEEDVLRALRAHSEPVATIGDLTDALDADVTSETVRRRLQSLHDSGLVGRKEVGARAVVWWAVDAETTEDAPAAPLKRLVGLLSEEEAERARKRSEEWREGFNREVDDGGA